MTTKLLAAVIVIVSLSCAQPVKKNITLEETSASPKWQQEVTETLKLFGHRNWIVIADGAYPQQSNAAIKTIIIDATQLEAVDFVSKSIAKANHITANIYTDKEMAFVAEEDATGIEDYRKNLDALLKGKPVKNMLHEDIIRELDASAKLFNVLIIKTNMAIPYTSVFFQLECGYWNAKAEEKLRNNLLKQRANTND
jgi:L-fucose mutarotase/ribose pyranase (RbsD/FucU family)